MSFYAQMHRSVAKSSRRGVSPHLRVNGSPLGIEIWSGTQPNKTHVQCTSNGRIMSQELPVIELYRSEFASEVYAPLPANCEFKSSDQHRNSLRKFTQPKRATAVRPNYFQKSNEWNWPKMRNQTAKTMGTIVKWLCKYLASNTARSLIMVHYLFGVRALHQEIYDWPVLCVLCTSTAHIIVFRWILCTISVCPVHVKVVFQEDGWTLGTSKKKNKRRKRKRRRPANTNGQNVDGTTTSKK